MGNGGKIPRVEPGKPILTRSINGIVNAANRLRMLQVAPPLAMNDGPQGPVIRNDQYEGFWARLTGNSSNAYSYQEVVWQGGTTVDVTGGRTGTTSTRPAYEVNGVATLAVGWVDYLRPGAPGEYVFQSVKYGSSGCATGTLVFTVTGCGVNQAGATVTVTGPGGFSASGTTNGSGQVTFSVVGYPAGTYSWTVTKGVRFQSQSGTKSVSCSTTNTQAVSLSAATGYRCASCCGIPIKENLWLTTPFGTTIAFNFVATQWQGTAVESLSCRKDAGCVTSSTEDCSFFYSMLGSGCSPVGVSGSGTGSGGYDISTSPPTMICDAANTCSNRAVQVIVLGNTITCEPFTTTGTARFVYNPSTGVTNDYGTISVTE